MKPAAPPAQMQSTNQRQNFDIENSSAALFNEPPRPAAPKFAQNHQTPSRITAQTAAPPPQVMANSQRPSTAVNCDISLDVSQVNNSDRRKTSGQMRMQEDQMMAQMQQQRNPVGKPQMAMLQQSQNFRQPSRPDMMSSLGAEPSGGYNFQRVMDDHFEHYKRPPSRERSVDLTNLPTALVEAKIPSRSSRGPSRNRTPLPANPSLNNPTPAAAATTDSIDAAAAANRMKRSGSGARVGATPAPTPETKTNGVFTDPMFGETGGVRYRAPSQEVTHIGAIPKRTESLYLKHSLTTDSTAIVRKVFFFIYKS